MNKFSSSEIIKLLDTLIGPTEAVGETNADNEILKNLETLIDITDWCLDGLNAASETCGRPEKSMHEIGWTAQYELCSLKRWLCDILEEK